MNQYYTANITLVWMALCVMCIVIREDHRVMRRDKRLFYLTYALIAVSALAEWCGVQLNGRADMPRWMLLTAKCADYVLTPMAGGALVAQMRQRNRWFSAMMGILAANTLFQIIGAARCIERALNDLAVCYRTGGDEFVALGNLSGDQAETVLSHIRRETARWQGESNAQLSLSVGYALSVDHPGLSAEKLVREADLEMYAAKAAYYREQGIDRRR